MINIAVYIQGRRLDLFQDERVEINLSVKNVRDVSKIFSDYTQTFKVPASPNNNRIFQHWYEADIDGTFNANIRVEGYLEVNSLPFRFGSIQLNDAKLEDLQAAFYSITFFSNAVNLSDLFGEDELSDLDLSAFDHVYDETVVQAMYSDFISSDMYYPLISALNEMSIGTTGDRDLIDGSNNISYREFKPALRLYKIIEAIQAKYGVAFTDDFFGRAVFYNLFLWLHRDAGYMKAFGNEVDVDITGAGTIATAGGTVNTTNNTITYDTFGTGSIRFFNVLINPDPGFDDIPYIVSIERNGVEVLRKEKTGTGFVSYEADEAGTNTVKAKVIAAASFDFASTVTLRNWDYLSFPAISTTGTAVTANQSITAQVLIADQMPQMKVKDFFVSLINKFNLAIIPLSATEFYIDTLDNWYSKGRTFDITRYVDIKEIDVRRPDVKKLISFSYEKAGAILGARYLADFNVGYGDLKAQFITSGDELKIESKFENMMFERLPNEATSDLTDIQAGYAIDKNLEPYKGAPFIFYRNGFTDILDDLVIQPSANLNRIYHTATEDNLLSSQVTNALNFGDDLSSYFYTNITQSLYFNFWKTYIEDLYNTKTRVLTLNCPKLPVSILFRLRLNDKIVFRDKRYKISSAKIDLTTGRATLEVFTDHSQPADSTAVTSPLTVDTTMYTVDTTLLTADMTYTHLPVISYTTNGISATDYLSTAADEHFEIKVSANTNWTVTKIDDGDGIGWFSSNKTTGNKTDYIRVSLLENTSGSYRTATLHFDIGTDSFDLTIKQRG